MSCHEFARRRRARWEIDCAIHERLAELEPNRAARGAFERLVMHVRAASSLLHPAPRSGRPAWTDAVHIVRGLAALAESSRYWRQEPSLWQPTGDRRLPQFGKLAAHLFGGHPVPPFLTQAWFEPPSRAAGQQQLAFRHLAGGHHIRGLDFLVNLTKGEARFLAETPHHFTLWQAIHWCKVRSSGADRNEAMRILCPRMVAGQTSRRRPDHVWLPTGVRGFEYIEQYGRAWLVRRWRIRELTDSDQLDDEAEALHHCVAGYAKACAAGRTSIWSLTCTDHRGADRHELTIELNPKTREIIQARGRWDKRPTSNTRELMTFWVLQEGLRVSDHV
jgi:hypothetical protein